MAARPSRIFEMIDLYHQFKWPLTEETQHALWMARNTLNELDFFVFLKSFEQCFFVNRERARQNMATCFKLGLLPALFGKTEYGELVPDLQVFLESTLDELFDSPRKTRMVELLAAFSLTLMKSHEETVSFILKWLHSSILPEDEPKFGWLKDALPGHIYRYMEKTPLCFNTLDKIPHPIGPYNPYPVQFGYILDVPVFTTMGYHPLPSLFSPDPFKPAHYQAPAAKPKPTRKPRASSQASPGAASSVPLSAPHSRLFKPAAPTTSATPHSINTGNNRRQTRGGRER